MAAPLQAFAARAEAGGRPQVDGYGKLVDMGDLSLPRGFRYSIISQEGEPMDDGNPTPSSFDGMAAFAGPDGRTILFATTKTARPRATQTRSTSSSPGISVTTRTWTSMLESPSS
jgi:secreted PhoX family phosphatase